MHNFFPFPQLSWVKMRKIKVRNTKNNIFPPRIGLPKRTGQEDKEDKEDKRRIGTHLKTKGKKTHLQYVNSIWKSCPKETGKIQQWPIFLAKYRELNSGLRLWYRIVYIIAESLSYWVFIIVLSHIGCVISWVTYKGLKIISLWEQLGR